MFYAATPCFAESDDYLSVLGVLLSSVSSREVQVIIPNYLQASSNYIVALFIPSFVKSFMFIHKPGAE